MYANYAVYLCSQACDLVAARTKYTELREPNGCTTSEFRRRWLHVWTALQRWFHARPAELHPLQIVEAAPFPYILFTHWAAISGNQLYHTGCMLLLNSLPRDITLDTNQSSSAVWHAKRICGISQSNSHEGCLNNAIQPLWVAGRLLSHIDEHKALVKLIRSIEARTGWGVCWRLRDLEDAWGYKVRTRN